MEFLDEYESKPRFLFQSKNLPRPDEALHPSSSSLSSLHKPTIFISLCFSLLVATLAFIYFDFEPLKSILLWLSLSLLLGPFAPSSITGGDIRVGVGPPLKEIPVSPPIETNEKPSRKSAKSIKKAPEDAVLVRNPDRRNGVDVDSAKKRSNGALIEEKSEEWSEVDDELLKKQLAKYPVGMPGRWDAIAEGLKGKHKVETVIAKAKQVGDKKGGGDQDSFKKFLKDRKKGSVDEEENGDVEEECGWSSAEDLALLNALKVFHKDVAMRWERIASSVPGKSKADCVKRVAELKKDFRTSKTSAQAS